MVTVRDAIRGLEQDGRQLATVFLASASLHNVARLRSACRVSSDERRLNVKEYDRPLAPLKNNESKDEEIDFNDVPN